jgi:hypothetical protein
VRNHFRELDAGWFLWLGEPATDGELRVRIEQSDGGRVRLVALQMAGQISAEALRSIPIGRIEAAANAELHPSSPATPPHPAEAAIPADLRSSAVRGYPDAFYEAIAGAYRRLAAISARPVGEIAEANDVPVTTAQRWVKEARRRGFLAPGHPGKAG